MARLWLLLLETCRQPRGDVFTLWMLSFSVSSLPFLPLRNDGTEFGGSIYQKVNDQLETAVNLAWTAGNSNTRFGIAAKYQIDADAAFSVSTRRLLSVPIG